MNPWPRVTSPFFYAKLSRFSRPQLFDGTRGTGHETDFDSVLSCEAELAFTLEGQTLNPIKARPCVSTQWPTIYAKLSRFGRPQLFDGARGTGHEADFESVLICEAELAFTLEGQTLNHKARPCVSTQWPTIHAKLSWPSPSRVRL